MFEEEDNKFEEVDNRTLKSRVKVLENGISDIKRSMEKLKSMFAEFILANNNSFTKNLVNDTSALSISNNNKTTINCINNNQSRKIMKPTSSIDSNLLSLSKRKMIDVRREEWSSREVMTVYESEDNKALLCIVDSVDHITNAVNVNFIIKKNEDDTIRDNGLFKTTIDKDPKLDNRILEECSNMHEDLVVCIHYVQLSLKSIRDVKNIIRLAINGLNIEDLVKEDLMVVLSTPKIIVLPIPAKPPDKELLTYY